ncbi:hypothetical protein [Methylobacterium radiodurans]|uniref:Chemotaxis protein CheZ n=1 Tax=Methylobacterium radiodurans TaxID=2202828 RepID=A0A2U8VTF0_9HYPH|nr:hypothetical protein [Methylobacterium radiodurans]AWN36396.1 hypothetical protein DK427_12215 [Methylobacterium radiodurans]
MSGSQSLTPYEPDAYEVIARAMAESERGRWFLDEHARRNRGSDTGTVLDAIARLENVVTSQRPPDDLAHLRGNLLDMANAISRTKAEIAAISAPGQDQSRLGTASEALDAIVRTTERATSDILGAAEQVQEAAWLLRERGVEGEFCDRLDRHATQIYTACSFQDLTAQRTSRIVHTLRYLEDRLSSMIAIWDADGARLPPAPGTETAEAAADLCQSDVDRFIDAEATPVAVASHLGATALDDDLAFVEAPVVVKAESATEPVMALEIEGAVVTEAAAEETALDVFEPVGTGAEVSTQSTPDLILGFDVEEPAPALAALIDAHEEPTAEVPPAGAASEDLILAVAEPAPEAAVEFQASLDVSEPGDTEAAIRLSADDTAAEEAQKASEKPNEAPATLDDIDLLSIEEKLALFS